MIGGWSTPSVKCLALSSQSSKEDYSITGKILSQTSTGAWTFEIELQSDDNNDSDNDNDNVKINHRTTTVLVKLNAEQFPDLKPWMTIRKARKLLYPGVSLLVHCCRSTNKEGRSNTNSSSSSSSCSNNNININNDENQKIHASKIQIVAVLPATSYLIWLLSFSKEHLEMLFDDNLIHVACALRPCTLQRLEELLQVCETKIQNNHEEKSSNLFKDPRLLELCDEIRIDQGWSRGPQKAPSTPYPVWLAMLRMEQQWLTNDEVDGAIEHGDDIERQNRQSLSDGDDHHQPQQVIYGGINVDPSLNVPDPTDQKRISYIDQCKRPQVMWMVRHICHLVDFRAEQKKAKENNIDTNNNCAKQQLHLIDIGGGRGDLAIAVAAYFAQFSSTLQSHVTVIDINKSSLCAAEDRAAAASLSDNMSFICQDITDREGLLQKLSYSQHGRYDLVFGLHCCGGLAEAAVDVALFLKTNFSVSTCCFRSHPQLAVLSRIADTTFEDNAKDRDLVASLAVLTRGQGQHRGIRVLNAMRLAAARQSWSATNDDEERVLKTWQETFPIEYSVQNRIMIGIIDKVSTVYS